MKYKNKVFKPIAILLSIIMVITVFPVDKIYATENINNVKTFFSEIMDETEASREAYIDSKSPISAGNWYWPTKYDRLPWNFFHNAVQDYIKKEYKNIVFTEKK